MKYCIAHWIREAAGVPQTQVSKVLQKLIKSIGKKDPAGTRTSPEAFYTQAINAVDKLVGHGMSQDAYDKFKGKLESAKEKGIKAMLLYISNYMLAGTGQRVLAEIAEKNEGKFTRWCKKNGFKGVNQAAINKAFEVGGSAKKMALFAVNFNPDKYKMPK